MAITDTRPDRDTVETVYPWDNGEEHLDVANVLGSGDHKTIGRFYIGFALLFGIAAWVLDALVTLDPVKDLRVLPADSVAQALSLSRLGLVLLFAVPLFVGLATYVVPLQVGAATVAFPRAAAAAFWSWLLGSVLLIVSYAINGGIAGGRAKGVELGYLAIGVTVLALLLASICIVTTIVALRAPGMRLDDVPMFSWGMFVAASVWMLSMPVFLANVLLIYVDFHFGRPSDFGVGANQWGQLIWFFQQPQLFVVLIPMLGAVSDIIATTAGVRQRHRGVLLGGIAAFGVLSFGAFAQEAFNKDVWEQFLFVVVGVGIMLPVAMVVASWLATMLGGRPKLTTPVLASLFTTLLLLLAALGSALYVIKPLRLHDTPTFQDGLLVLVIGTATVGGIAALHYWAPKIWGRMANDVLGKLAALLGVGGALLGGLSLCVLGFANRWDGLADASDSLHVVSVAGDALLALAVLVVAVSLFGRGHGAPDDPWGGQTLEWATSSPPPPGNFGELPQVTSAAPLLDAQQSDTEEAVS